MEGAYRWPRDRGGVFSHDLVGAKGGDEAVADRTGWQKYRSFPIKEVLKAARNLELSGGGAQRVSETLASVMM